MRALCSSADGVLGQKQQSERKHGARRKTPEKRGDVRLKAVEGPDGKDSQKCYRLATYLIVSGLHLVNHFRTSSRKICVPPLRFEGLRYIELCIFLCIYDNLASARVEILRRANIGP